MALAFKIDPEIQSKSGHSRNLKVARFPKANSPAVAASRQRTEVKGATVSPLPKTPRLPVWMKFLVGMQQGSTVVTGGLVAATLVVYSWTVYVDRTIARTGRQLEALQVTAQQITTANETLKHNMAEQATGPKSSFEPYQPDKAIFLKPAPGRPSTESAARSSAAPTAASRSASMPHPLGY